MNKHVEKLRSDFIWQIKEIIAQAQNNAVRAIDYQRVLMYWNIGKTIIEEEQQGKERAEYGTYLIRSLSKELKPDYGTSFSVRQLELSRQFFRIYPIANALRSQLNWTQYRLLIRIEDESKREYYLAEAARNNWTARQLERQINSQLYERLLLSSDKKRVLAVAQGEQLPEDNKTILASQYKLYLPSEEALRLELVKELEREKRVVEVQFTNL